MKVITKKRHKKDVKYVKKHVKGNRNLYQLTAASLMMYELRYGTDRPYKVWNKLAKKLKKYIRKNRRNEVDEIINSLGEPQMTNQKQEPVLPIGQ